MLRRNIKIFLNFVLICCIFISGVATYHIHAEPQTVEDYGSPLEDENVVRLDFDEDTCDGSGKREMVLNEPYVTHYPSALDYFGKPLTVVVTAKLIENTEQASRGMYSYLSYGHGVDVKYVFLEWHAACGAKVNIKVDFIDPETNEPYKINALLGIQDPDESHYLFDTSNRNIYYSYDEKDTEKIAAKRFIVENDGLYVTDESGNKIDSSTWMKDAPNFNEARFLIELNYESSFEFTTDTLWYGGLVVPYIYSRQYNVNYVLNDAPDSPAVNPESNPNKYATQPSDIVIEPASRPGFTFLGWKENDVPNNKIPAGSQGDKTFVAQWEAIEYKLEYDKNNQNATGTMSEQTVTVGDNDLHENQFSLKGYKFIGWSTKEGDNPVEYQPTDKSVPVTAEDVKDKDAGDTVKVLYAQWEPLDYTIMYDANGGKGDMEPNEYKGSDESMPSENEWSFTREGYSFAGFKVENEGETYNGSKDFKDTLLDDEDRKITLFAQWEPWKYYVKYEPNGGVGEMKTQTFIYTDEKMNSKENQFVRDGYEFIGFEFEHNGAKYIITSTKDFNDMLKELGPNSSITLVAQWRKLPDPIVKYYALPVTGVEDYR